MTIADLNRLLQVSTERLLLAWSRTLELLADGRLKQLRLSDLVIIWLTCLALGWFIDAALRDSAPDRKKTRPFD